jgi:hypothetical protein
MATKPVTVLPAAAAAAGCAATCESYASGTSETTSWTNYSCAATEVGEWVLLRWEFVTTYTYRDGHTSTASWTRDAYNPYPPSRRDDVWVSPYDATYTYSGALYPSDVISATFTVTAVFHYYHTRTNLLVNSFNREPRVRLVYDPDTNLLVGDY